ncbi:TetR/AcrR family transcriptional regulator [Mycolicibacterium sp. XJ1819]
MATEYRVNGSAAAARIRRAAVEAFAESGYGGSSTRDIGKRIEMSGSAIYPHYKNKEQLLFEISLDGHRGALQAVRSADDPAAEPVERLRAVVSAFTRWQATERQLARVVQYELHALTPEHFRVIATLRRDTTAVIEAIVRAGLASGAFTAANPDTVVLAISSLCVDVCRWFPTARFSDVEKLAREYGDIAVKLVRP